MDCNLILFYLHNTRMFNNLLKPKFLKFHISDRKLTSVKFFSRKSEREDVSNSLSTTFCNKNRRKKIPIFLKQLFCWSHFVSNAVFVCHNDKCLHFTHLEWTNKRNSFERKQLEALECNCSVMVLKPTVLKINNLAEMTRKDHLFSLCQKEKNWSPIKLTSVAPKG